jgi:hypothetical protein
MKAAFPASGGAAFILRDTCALRRGLLLASRHGLLDSLHPYRHPGETRSHMPTAARGIFKLGAGPRAV